MRDKIGHKYEKILGKYLKEYQDLQTYSLTKTQALEINKEASCKKTKGKKHLGGSNEERKLEGPQGANNKDRKTSSLVELLV